MMLPTIQMMRTMMKRICPGWSSVRYHSHNWGIPKKRNNQRAKSTMPFAIICNKTKLVAIITISFLRFSIDVKF